MIWKIWYLAYSEQIMMVDDIIAIFLIAVEMSKKHKHWKNFTKSCDFSYHTKTLEAKINLN